MNPILIIIPVALLVILIFVIKSLVGKVPPMSEGEAIQHGVTQQLNEDPNPSSGTRSFGKIIMLLILLAVIMGALILAFKGGFDFHP